MVFPDAGGENEETVGVKIVTDTRQAVDDIAKWREEINKLKQEMRELAQSTGESLGQVRRALVEQQKETLSADQFKEYKTNIMQAQREINQEQRNALNERRQMANEEARELNQNAILKRQIAQQEAQEKQAQIKQNIALQKEAADEERRLAIETAKAKQSDIQQQIVSEKYLADQTKRTATDNARYKKAEIDQQVLLRKYLDDTTKSTSTLGDISKFVFGGILGLTAITVLRDLVNWFKQLTREGYEFVKGIYQMEVGVRALQRAGMDITIRELYENLRVLREEFGTFTTKDLVVGAAQFTNLTRDLGFTKDQFFELQNSVATLAVVNGRAMDEVQRTVALALSSGYTEGLQRLGVSINRVNIAQEAATMGWRGGYTALTEQQRALATYNLIIQKTAIYQKDLQEYQRTSPGEIDRASASWKEFTNNIGKDLLPILGTLAGLFADILELLEKSNEKQSTFVKNMKEYGNIFSLAFSNFRVGIMQLEAFDKAIEKIQDRMNPEGRGGRVKTTLRGYIKLISDAFKEARAEVYGEGELLGDETLSPEGRAEKLAQQVSDAIANSADDIEKVVEDTNDRRRELAEDLQRDLAKIEEDGARRRAEIERDYAREIEDINRKASRDIAEAQRKYAYDIAKLKQDEKDKVQDVIDKYREKELKDEEDFQAKMKKLRQEFIFDLEEAVRARDAVSIRRLQRRFNLDKQQLVDAYELEKKQRERNFRQELEEARKQNAERRKELAIAFQQRIEDIERQRQYELQDAAIKHQQDLEDLRRRLQEQREERLRAYRQDLEDLNKVLTERLRKLAQALAQEVEYTAQSAKAVYDILKAYYGPGGYIEQLYKYYLEYSKQVPSLPKGVTPPSTPTTPGFAFGGSILATTPTTIRLGETVPEIANITPLINRNTSFSDARANVGSMNGNIKVLVSLSPGLEGKIIEDTLNQFDGILAGIERSR